LRAAVLRRVAVLAAAPLVLLASASPSMAASTLSVAGETVTLSDPVGERNQVTVNHGNNPGAAATVDDFAGIAPVAPCGEFAGIGYACPTLRRPTFILELGAGDDVAQVINAAAAGTHSELRGGDGDDQLASHEGSDTLDGGAGDDLLSPDDDHPSPGDDVRGGAGRDHLQLAPVVSPEIVTTLDDRADDGQPGHGDNFRSDIEDVTGSQTARNTIAGTARANVLTGQGQGDRLTGGGGRDTLDGREGSDTLDALDAAPGDRLTCGGGADVALADGGDVVTGDCERVVRAPAVGGSTLRRRGGRVTVRLACPRGGGTCKGRLRLTTTAGKRLGSGTYRVKPGRTAAVTFAARKRRRAVLYVAPAGTDPVAGRDVRIR
jgi:hypothetical protein